MKAYFLKDKKKEVFINTVDGEHNFVGKPLVHLLSRRLMMARKYLRMYIKISQ